MNLLINISPLITLAASSILILMVTAFYRNHLLVKSLSLAGLLLSAYSLLYVDALPVKYSNLFVIDDFGIFIVLLILLAAAVVVMLSYPYLENKEGNKEEYYVILLLGTLGASTLAISNHFISFFLGLELLSIALYILIGYTRRWQNSVEASVKYLILAGTSSAILLMGMALIYAETGMMNFKALADHFTEWLNLSPIGLIGVGMIVAGIGFKLAVVPFHLWTPDVYDGAPAPTSAFIATISKGGVLALWFRFFNNLNGYQYPTLVYMLGTIAVFTMLIGNILALRQQNIKRILAYSSIAHMGYMLVAFLAGGESGIEAISFYLLAYFITILGAFGVVTLLSDQSGDASAVEDYQGLFWRRPWVAAVLTAMLLSLAGIPLTAGFIGKYYILAAGVGSGLWFLVVVLIASSVIGLFYCLRVVVAMFKVSDSQQRSKELSLSISLTIGALAVCLIWFGIYPSYVAEVIKLIAEVGF